MKKLSVATRSIKSCWEVHDSWTEVLTGTYFLLGLIASKKHSFDNIEELHLGRMVIITSSQLVEMMFNQVVDLYIKEYSNDLCKCCLSRIDSDKKKQTGIKNNIETWIPMLIGESNKIDFGSNEVYQSLKTLMDRRNETVHRGVNNYDLDFANAAYYTAIKVSEDIWKKFFPKLPFKYAQWIEERPALSDELFYKVWVRYLNENNKEF